MPVWPVPIAPTGAAPVISSPYGAREDKYHYGADIMWKRAVKGETALPQFSPGYYLTTGTPALAFTTGTVVAADNTGHPYRVLIDHGGGLQTQYIHLAALKVHKGQRVREGQPIGIIGYNPDGYQLNHLHFEVIYNGAKVDPVRVLVAATPVGVATGTWLKVLGIGLPVAAVGAGAWWWFRGRA